MPGTLLQPEQRVLSTLERDGSRRWLSPRLARGRFLTWRRVVAYALIAIFTLIPYLRINGKPAVLLDIVHRQFTIAGFTFLPTDTILLALLMVTLIVGIFAATALLGRVWCGWACPQTVYLEFVFRPFERLFLGRGGIGGKSPRPAAGWRYVAMYVTFLLVSFYLAHTFLAYFVGVENLRKWIFGSPMDHPAAFLVVMVVTGLMMFDFAFFREQTCIIACPYGRFQSVLLDRSSLLIAYDRKRGEPRGKKLRVMNREPPVASQLATRNSQLTTSGDCIDCTMCVQVCPTGIDIRDGLQLECVGCAQCIDACDAVMDKIDRPRGLIRYSSQAAMGGELSRILRPRVVIYSALVIGLASLLGYLLMTKSPTDLTVLRAPGRPYVLLEDGRVENNLRLKITNRTDRRQTYRIETAQTGIELHAPDALSLDPGEVRTDPLRILADAERFLGSGRSQLEIRVVGDRGGVVGKVLLLGPTHHATTKTGGVDAKR